MFFGRFHHWMIAVSFVNITLTTPTGSPDSATPGFCKPIVIAHRGASGYIPEHTLAAYTIAIEMGADFIEPDIVITKDKHLIALHYNQLGVSTDIANHPEFGDRKTIKFINRKSIEGWFAEDFTLEEIKKLRVMEPIPKDRPCNVRMNNIFEIPTLEEVINLVKNFENGISKRIIGICPEIKYSSYFTNLNLSIEKPLVDILHKNGFRGNTAPVYIQSSEITSLKQLKNLTDLKLLFLYDEDMSVQPEDQIALGTNLTYGDLSTSEGLKKVATFANAVGPDKSTVIPYNKTDISHHADFVQAAHAAGLEVFPYTFRLENPTWNNFTTELKNFFAADIDGVFTDYPDVAISIRGECPRRNLKGSSSRISLDIKLITFVIVIIFYFL